MTDGLSRGAQFEQSMKVSVERDHNLRLATSVLEDRVIRRIRHAAFANVNCVDAALSEHACSRAW